jgi:ABC-type branched-subunit amino acid transport system substrate-binding protein
MIALGFGLVSCTGSSSSNAPTGPVNIGVLGGFTGTTLTYGTALFEGTTIAANLIDQNGGIMNRQIHLIPINTASDPVDAVTAVRKMLAFDNVSGATGL